MDSKVLLKETNSHENANFVAKIFLTWSFSFFRRGYKQSLTVEDLWQTRKVDQSGRLADRLEEAWQEELDKAKECKEYKPSLSKAIISSFWLEYMFCGFLIGILFIFLWPMIPYTLGLYIDYFAGPRTEETYRNAHIYNFLMNFLSIFTALAYNHLSLAQGCIGMRIRIACCSLIYRKILKLNRGGLSKTEPGHVVNLMSNDVNRFDLVVLFLNYLWVMPIMVPVVAYLVWQHVTYATLTGLAVTFLQTVLVQAYLSNLQGALRGKIAKRTDERVKVMSELVNGVQVIKMYAWEKPFEKLVDKLRKSESEYSESYNNKRCAKASKKLFEHFDSDFDEATSSRTKLEVNFIMRTSMVKGFSTALTVFTERFILYATVVTFVVIGGRIDSGITFSLLQYFNLLQLACNIFVPLALAFLAETRVSIRRIEEFLFLDEIKTTKYIEAKLEVNDLKPINNDFNKLIEKDSEKSRTKSTTLMISGVTASWQEDPIVSTLRNITITAAPGEFIGVAGLVGSGKSSLLQLILGELMPTLGMVTIGDARISYASQEPWLFAATVRQNILFGQPFDPVRYKKVVSACALLRDFELLPAGDATLVGERGAGLSGGQRARIGLARACYRQADIYLLDDPLSAVDTHVGKHLVSECVTGLLRHATRVLVTHQLHHLKAADKVVILHNGEVETVGSFETVSRSPLFAELLEEEEQPEERATRPTPLRQRSISIHSHASTSSVGNLEPTTTDEDEPEESAELSGKGRVSAAVYSAYFRAGSGWALLLFTVFSIILAQVVTSAGDLWLTYWMNNVDEIYSAKPFSNFDNVANNSLMFNETLLSTTTDIPGSTIIYTNISDMDPALRSPKLGQTTATLDISYHEFYIYIWTIGILGCIIFTTGRSMLFSWVCMRSSIKLHNTMFSNILSATMRFFDTNPSGRILNRFSKDMGVVDEILPRMYLESIQVFMVMLGILVMVAIVNPYMLLTTVVCGVLMLLWTTVYLNTAQSIKRLEGVSRSPVFSHVSATMAGLTTVRACRAEDMLRRHFDDKQDVHTSAWYLTLVTNTAFTIWLCLISALYVVVASYMFLILDDYGLIKSGNVGLALSQGLILVNMVQYGVKQATEVVSQMTSVERLVEFTSLPQENTEGQKPPNGWPQRARLIFKDLYLRYDEDADPVLKNLNVIIESGWKVGVVGRTGAGKSSLISALFRLAPIDGHVFIDDIDVGNLALKELRSKISIIPQEPVLFSASLRYNMDPFDKYTDSAIWEALEQVELKNSVTSLSSAVETGGSNFSAGQRQLLCLARAALAHNKLLVLDEATANVDPNTDALIQKSIRKHFTDCTVVTVAHRLHTVADSDRVIVMEAGQIVEYGHPHELLLNEEGHFTRMVKQLGAASEQNLRDLASAAYTQHIKYVDADDQGNTNA